MDADYDLMRAVKAANTEWFSDGSSIHLPRMLKHMEWQRNALTATVAEIRKRRAESPWKGPFKAMTVENNKWPSAQVYDTAELLSSKHGVGLWLRCMCDDDARSIAAALNSFFGYDAQGKDVLEGMGV